MFFSHILDDMPSYRALCECVGRGSGPVHVYGLSGSQKSHLIYSLGKATGKKCLVVAQDETQSGRIKDDLSFLFCNGVFGYPAREYVFYDVDAANHGGEYARIKTLANMQNANAVVTTMKAMVQYTIPKNVLDKYTTHISCASLIDADELCKNLNTAGYRRTSLVEGAGQYSRRGSIIDVFCPLYKYPIRIELFDDEVDSIREFDKDSQLSLKNITECVITPVRELIYNDRELDELTEKISRQKNENLNSDITKLKAQHYIPSSDKYMPFVYDEITTLSHYIDDNWIVIYDEPTALSDSADGFCTDTGAIITSMLEKGIFPKTKKQYFLSYAEVTSRLSGGALVSISTLSYTTPQILPKEIVNFTAKQAQNYSGNTDFLIEDIKFWKSNNYRVIIVVSQKKTVASMHTMLDDADIEATILQNNSALLPYGTVAICEGDLSHGFEYPSVRTAVICEGDIFQARKKRKSISSAASAKDKIRSFDELSVGDFVVHNVHGIGKYVGLAQHNVGNIIKDFLKIQYKGTDVLYIPTNQLESIHKYVGASENSAVSLNSLNGSKWKNTVKKVKQSVEEMAGQLIQLYAARESIQGHVFEPDTVWQKDFEDDFPFEETPDQLKCVEEIKADMEKGKCMDRLLCGDVGYGKTEVAMRAAFKCIMGGLQVAYLVPTTLLAQQHYNSFRSRMESYGINVELMCRFRSPKQQKQTLEKLKHGSVDVVIGTHRLLSKDVEFKNLGLLIIDEEQRFGVGHKEKLKELKNNVDVLTLTATPIPRTLNMAMVGIRDLSVITSPPQNRYPVQTFVMEYNGDVIKNAIERELARGGQVYYLSNRVDNIEVKAANLRRMLPDAVIEVAHGQMTERELESKMLDMMNGDIDVLVCTTIIETGIDIPNVNTMIIDNADMLGLSQLYQLRGRVGRSGTLAYAYLMYQGNKVLDETARKRLSAIREFTEFGSGFKIAMRDLEIRGAGNLLGKEQHGNMNLVGYDMYCSLLGEAVARQRGEAAPSKKDVQIELKVDVHIPDSYIENEEQRLDTYKRVSGIYSEEDYYSMQAELIDRFGDMPKSVENLLDCMYIKSMCEALGIESVVRDNGDVMFTIGNNNISPEAIVTVIHDFNGKIMFSSGEKSYLCYKYADNLLYNIKIILQKLINLTQQTNEQL